MPENTPTLDTEASAGTETKNELLVKAAARGTVGWVVPMALVLLAPGGWLKLALAMGWWGTWESASIAMDDARVMRGLPKLHVAIVACRRARGQS